MLSDIQVSIQELNKELQLSLRNIIIVNNYPSILSHTSPVELLNRDY